MLLEKAAAMTISKEMLDELLKGCERPEDLLGEAGLMKELKVTDLRPNFPPVNWRIRRLIFGLDLLPKFPLFGI